jgi:hypothetical protein
VTGLRDWGKLPGLAGLEVLPVFDGGEDGCLYAVLSDDLGAFLERGLDKVAQLSLDVEGWGRNGSTAAGKTLLVGDDGPVAILNFENYVMVLGPSKLLIWPPSIAGDTLTPPVHFLILDPRPFKTAQPS